MKESVQAVLLNSNGEVLAVSRKDDHSNFGLCGGKVDDGETREEAMIRECKEESGLTIKSMIPVFQMHKWGYMGYTYLVTDWEGEISTNEPHIVKFAPYDIVLKGSFGKWNKLVAESLISMGINFMLHDDNCELCGGSGQIAGIFDENDIRPCHGFKHLYGLRYLKHYTYE